MKKMLFLSLLTLGLTTVSHSQDLKWISFNWVNDTLNGRYFEKLGITLPVHIENVPNVFTFQFDLGANESMIYENSIKNYLLKYKELGNQLDKTDTSYINGSVLPHFKNIRLVLGKTPFDSLRISEYTNFGDEIPVDSLDKNMKVIAGTIGADFFRDKVLILDYKNRRIGISRDVPATFKKIKLGKCDMKEGRIYITYMVNGKPELFMFDTGSSLLPILTTEENARTISNGDIADSMKASTWGETYTLYASKITAAMSYEGVPLPPAYVYFDKIHKFEPLVKNEHIFGMTGNTYFLNKVIIIDFKNQLFGVSDK